VTYAGVKWEGRAHSGLDDATNTARLAAALIRQGATLNITNSFKIYATDGSRIERVLRKRPLEQADGNAGRGVSGNGRGQGDRCHCGVKRRRRTVKKPGPTHGHAFFSCGKWTITGGGNCDYFEWA
jgi:ERI1 exoribonuclease 2